jgi:electron transfer flavoprotein alpha/beta subunit
VRARQQPVRSFSAADLGVQAEQLATKGYRILTVHPPERARQVELLQGNAQEVAAALLGKIRESR